MYETGIQVYICIFYCLFEYIIINLRAIESNNFWESYMSVLVRNKLCGYETLFRLLYM
jgi:hypothetical protein